MTPEEISKFDQNLATLAEFFPRCAWSLFQGFKAQGFSESQAMELVNTWLLSVSTNK